jgi:hypothetical protein
VIRTVSERPLLVWRSEAVECSVRISSLDRNSQLETLPLTWTVIASFDLAIVPLKLRPDPWAWL